MYYIVDAYSGMVEDTASTRRLADEKLDELGAETGLFIWRIVQASNKRDLQRQMEEDEDRR